MVNGGVLPYSRQQDRYFYLNITRGWFVVLRETFCDNAFLPESRTRDLPLSRPALILCQNSWVISVAVAQVDP